MRRLITLLCAGALVLSSAIVGGSPAQAAGMAIITGTVSNPNISLYYCDSETCSDVVLDGASFTFEVEPESDVYLYSNSARYTFDAINFSAPGSGITKDLGEILIREKAALSGKVSLPEGVAWAFEGSEDYYDGAVYVCKRFFDDDYWWFECDWVPIAQGGHFLVYVDPGEYYVYADVDNFYLTQSDLLVSTAYGDQPIISRSDLMSVGQSVVVSDTSVSNVNFTMQMGGLITGTVTPSTARAWVESCRWKGGSWGDCRRVYTDEHGDFTLGVVPSSEVGIRVGAQGYSSVWLGGYSGLEQPTVDQVTTITGPATGTTYPTSLNFSLVEQGTVKGTITSNSEDSPWVYVCYLLEESDPSCRAEGYTDSDGSYSMAVEPNVTFTIRAMSDNDLPGWYGGYSGHSIPAPPYGGVEFIDGLDSGQVLEGIDITLTQAPSSPAVLEGTIRSNPQALEVCHGDDSPGWWAHWSCHDLETDSDGSFLVEVPAYGEVQIWGHWDWVLFRAPGPGQIMNVGDIDFGNDSWKSSSISGTVTLPSVYTFRGAEVAACTVDTIGGEPFFPLCNYANTDSQGKYTIYDLEPDVQYAVFVYSGNLSVYSSEFLTTAYGGWSGEGWPSSEDIPGMQLVTAPPEATTLKEIDIAMVERSGPRLSGTITLPEGYTWSEQYGDVMVCEIFDEDSWDCRTVYAFNGQYTTHISQGSQYFVYADLNILYISETGLVSTAYGNIPVLDSSHAKQVGTPLVAGTQDLTGIDITMQVGGMLTGTVSGPDSSSIVSVCPVVGSSFLQCSQAFTNENGTYRISAVPGSTVALRAAHDGYISTWLGGSFETHPSVDQVSLITVPASGVTSSEQYDFTLLPSGKITGTVSLPNDYSSYGDNLAGVVSREVIRTPDEVYLGEYNWSDTDADGYYEINAQPGQEYVIYVDGSSVWEYPDVFLTTVYGGWVTPNYTPLDSDIPNLVTVTGPASGETVSGIDIMMQVGGVLTGTVYGPESGFAIQVCPVINSEISNDCRWTNTDWNGNYRIVEVPGSLVTMRAFGNGYHPVWLGGSTEDYPSIDQVTLITVPLGEVVVNDFTLIQLAMVTGTVTLPNGSPAEYILVEYKEVVRTPDGDYLGSSLWVGTDENGHYAAHILPDKEYVFFVRNDSIESWYDPVLTTSYGGWTTPYWDLHDSDIPSLVTVSAGPGETLASIDITMAKKPGFHLSGTIILPQGYTWEDGASSVDICQVDRDLGDDLWDWFWLCYTAPIGDDGQYSSFVEEGYSYVVFVRSGNLMVSKPGLLSTAYGDLPIREEMDAIENGSLVVVGNQDINDINITVQEGGILSGVVSGPDTASVIEVCPVENSVLGQCAMYGTNEDGSYHIALLPGSTVALRASHSGYLSQWLGGSIARYPDIQQLTLVTVPAAGVTSSTQYNLALQEAGRITGRVTLPSAYSSGAAFSQVIYGAVDRTSGTLGDFNWAHSDSDGFFEVDAIPGQEYIIFVPGSYVWEWDDSFQTTAYGGWTSQGVWPQYSDLDDLTTVFGPESGETLSGIDIIMVEKGTQSYTVTFDSNNGSGDTTSVTTTGELTIPENTFEYDGYSFTGWRATPGGSGTQYLVGSVVTVTKNLSLYAQWEQVTPSTVSVTFDAAGGTPASTVVTATVGETVSLPTVTKDGFDFGGWFTGENGTGTQFTALTEITQALTVYAKWVAKPTFTVSYDANGGTGTLTDSNTYYSGATATAKDNVFSRTGYTFDEWNSTPNGSGTPYAEGSSILVTSNLTLFAQWTANPVTVTFDSDGGSAVSPVSSTYGSTIALPAAPTKSGFAFAGWFTEPGGEGTEFTAATVLNADVTVYAKWSAASVTVTFDSDGGSVVSSVSTTYGSTISLLAAPTKTGYAFGGWFTAKNGGGTQFTASTVVKSNITVYAKWTANQVTVTFDSDGGSKVSSVKSTYGSTITLPKAPTKTGYTFGGWFTQKSGKGTQFTQSTVLTGNLTVYAKWTVNPPVVTFDAQGGSPSKSTVVTSGGKAKLPKAPTKKGYTFGGWYVAKTGCSSVFTESTVVKKDTTVYAKWLTNTSYSKPMSRFTLGADMTADGRGEILAVDKSGRLVMFPGRADGKLGTPALLGTGFGSVDVYGAGDLNGDGCSDVLGITKSGELWLYPGTGGSPVGAATKIGWGWTGWTLIPAGDVNGDQKVDLLGINARGDLYMFAGKGKGQFAARVKVGYGWTGWTMYAGGDLNGDKKADLLGVNNKTGELFRYLGKGTGTFSGRQSLGTGWSGVTIGAGADLTGDGKADVIARPKGTSKPLYFYKGTGTKLGSKIQIDTGW